MSLIDPGKKAPAFSLPDQEGTKHSLADSASKAKFAAKYGLTFPLLADEDHAMMEKYGVWQEKSMYGKKYMGVARTTYLIGADGKVVKRWDGVKVDGHAEEVLAAVNEL
jgi:peroxiredoxin Q/BCP